MEEEPIFKLENNEILYGFGGEATIPLIAFEDVDGTLTWRVIGGQDELGVLQHMVAHRELTDMDKVLQGMLVDVDNFTVTGEDKRLVRLTKKLVTRLGYETMDSDPLSFMARRCKEVRPSRLSVACDTRPPAPTPRVAREKLEECLYLAKNPPTALPIVPPAGAPPPASKTWRDWQ